MQTGGGSPPRNVSRSGSPRPGPQLAAGAHPLLHGSSGRCRCRAHTRQAGVDPGVQVNAWPPGPENSTWMCPTARTTRGRVKATAESEAGAWGGERVGWPPRWDGRCRGEPSSRSEVLSGGRGRAALGLVLRALLGRGPGPGFTAWNGNTLHSGLL